LLDMPAGMENASTGTVSSRLESPQRLPAPPLRVPLRTAHSQADSPASFPIELFRLEGIRLWKGRQSGDIRVAKWVILALLPCDPVPNLSAIAPEIPPAIQPNRETSTPDRC
jgi:hypothetical protein